MSNYRVRKILEISDRGTEPVFGSYMSGCAPANLKFWFKEKYDSK